MFSTVTSAVALAVAFALTEGRSLNCDAFPNATQSAFHWFECESGNTFTVLELEQIGHRPGRNNYPVDITVDWADFTATNIGSQTYDRLIYDIKLASWDAPQCHWTDMPTLGLLDNKAVYCDDADCSLSPGATKLYLPLRLPDQISNSMTANKLYQFTLVLKNGSGAHEKVGCFNVQAKITK